MKLSFGNQCLLALVMGILWGAYAPLAWTEALTPIGSAYLQLLKMIIVPITFVLIVTSFTRLENLARIKNLGTKTLLWFLFTAFIAATVGLTLALLINPAQGFHQSLPLITLKDSPTMTAIFLDMIPGNLIDQIARGKVIPVIIFSVLFAIALTICGEEAKHARLFFEALAKVFMKLTRWVIRLSPIGIFVFIAEVAGHYGFSSLMPFGKFILTVYAACFIQLIIYGILLTVVCRINPFKFFYNAWPMLLTAFTTSSSLATLPVTIDTLKKMQIPSDVVSFVAPLGANAKMDGCGAIYPAILCVFTASLFQIPLDWHQYVVIVIMAMITTIGTAGVPGAAVVMTMVVLSSLGLPFTGLAMVIGIDKTVDMIRTTTNVAGTAVCATLVANHAYETNPEFALKTAVED